MALMPCWHPSFSCQSDLDKTRLLFLQEGSSLLCLIWCRDSSFGKYHAGMAQYVHVVCDLHKLFQAMLKEGMTTKLHGRQKKSLINKARLYFRSCKHARIAGAGRVLTERIRAI